MINLNNFADLLHTSTLQRAATTKLQKTARSHTYKHPQNGLQHTQQVDISEVHFHFHPQEALMTPK